MKNKNSMLQILTGTFVACLLMSNIMASKTFMVGDITLPSAVIIFPVVYIVNDVLAEVFGYQNTKRVIYLGFGLNILAVICYNIAMTLPPPVFALDISNAFKLTLSSTFRMLMASLCAYLVGSFSNAKIMTLMKEKTEEKLMFRCVASTFVGEGLDALIFISIAFICSMPLSDIIIMIFSQALFKTLFEILLYPVTKIVISKAKALPDA